MLKSQLIRLAFSALFNTPLRAVIYSRQPFPRWPYMFTPQEMDAMSHMLLGVNVSGSVVEVGCNQGWTSAFFLETLRKANVERPFVGIDTFEGFTTTDTKAEIGRGHSNGSFDGYFATCKREWYEYSLKRFGYQNVTAIQGDAAALDYAPFAPIAFSLCDVDLYRPTLLALRAMWPHVAKGGLVVVDDCDPKHELWDGAHQAYMEFCAETGVAPEITAGKLGTLRK